MKKAIRAIAMLLACACMLSGCMLRAQVTETSAEITLPDPPSEPRNMILGERVPTRSAGVTLYYAMADGTGFSAVTRNLLVDAGQSLPEAAVNALLSPAAGSESATLSMGDTQLLSCEYACGIATVNLSIDARDMQSEQSLLAVIMAINNTLLSLDGVTGVNVLIGSQSERICQLPLGLQTQFNGSVTAAYAQLQSDSDRFLGDSPAPLRRSVALYFPTDTGRWLVPEQRQIAFSDDDYATALLTALMDGPRDSDSAVASIPAGIELLEDPTVETLSSGERILDLNFSSALANYLAFSGLEVWELVGSIVLTMCSFMPEIDAVRIRVNGEAITVCEIGDVMLRFPNGLIHRRDFASRIGSIATLYLENERRELEPVRCAVSMYSAISPRSLLGELFSHSGAAGTALRFPAPQSFYEEDLLGIQVSGGVAMVNLSGAFYSSCQSLDALSERNLVYAIVNTLCQLSPIRGVRFYVEGLSAETLAGNIYLRTTLLPNPGIVAADPDAPAQPQATPGA